MPSFCAVLNCSDRYGHAESISFHKFPFKRKELLVSWLEFAQRGKDWQPSKWSAICSRHFCEQDFNCVNERKTLKKTACPTVRLDQVPMQDQKLQKEPIRKVIKQKNSKDINEQNALDLEGKVQNIPNVDENITVSAEEQTAASPSHSPLNVSKVNCRLCGHASSAVVTFSANFEIYGMIQKCFPTLNIQQDDNLPKEVCRICLKRLESFSCYIDKVLETQSELQRQFCTHERNQKSAASERQLKIKQEPVVRVKQEVAEGGGSFLSDDMEMGLDDLGGEQEQDDAVVDQKYQFCDFPLLNSQDIINNCDIMEIINLDDPFIDIPDDDGNTTCTDACLPTPTLLPAHRQADQARLLSAHELLQAHLLIEEHNYAYAAEDFKEEWQIKNNYKTEKLDDYEQENAEELGHVDAEEYVAGDNAPTDTALPSASDAANVEVGNVRQSTQEPGDNRSTKPIVTSVSDLQMEARSPTTSAVRGKDPHTKTKPNIVVLNESIVKSSSAFQLHACTVCQSKFFSVDSLSQHYAMLHQQQQQQMPVNNQQQQMQHDTQQHHQQMQHDSQQHFQQQQQNHQQQQQQYLQPKNEPHLLPNTHQLHQQQLQQQQHDKQQQQQQYQLHHTQQQPLPMVSVPSGNILAVEANEQQQSYKGEEKSADKDLPRRDSILTDVSSGNHKLQYTQPPSLPEADFSQLQSWQQPVRSYAPPQLLQQTSYQQPLNILDMQQSYARQQTPCYGGAPQTLVQNYYNALQPRPQLQYCPELNKQTTALLPGNYAHGLGLDGVALQMRLAAHEVVFKAPRPVATTEQHKRQAKMHKFVAEATSLRTAPRRHTTRASFEHVLAYYRQLRWRYRQLQRKCRNLQQNVQHHSTTPTPPPTTTTPQHTAAELRLQCRICRQRYANIAQLLRHRQTAPAHHVRKPSRFFASCFGCEKFFCSRLALRNHMRYICQTLPLRWFKTQMQSFKCRHCRSITFTHWRLYRRHELKCQLKQRQWQWQRRTHGELPLQVACQWRPHVAHRQQQHSPKVCYGNSDCTCKVGCQHSRCSRQQRGCTHAAKRKLSIHRCALCPCIFKRRSALRQHMQGFHLQLKPHVCAVCKRRFALKCDMLRCVQAHAGKRSLAATAQRISCSHSRS